MHHDPSLSASLLLALLLLGAAAAEAQTSAAELESRLNADPRAGLMEVLDAADARWRDVRSFRALLVRQERKAGEKEPRPEESIDYKFLKDHCVLMVWNGEVDTDKKVLFVRGQYSDLMSVKTKVTFFWYHGEFEPDDPKVMEETNHPITESGFGMALHNIRKRVEGASRPGEFKATFVGRQKGPDNRDCLVVRGDFTRLPGLVRSTVWFDAESFMPIKVINEDRDGVLERYEYRRLRLDPMLGSRPELTVRDFHRSQAFDHGGWQRERETWTFADVCRDADRLDRLQASRKNR
jgi:hypothetical protein